MFIRTNLHNQCNHYDKHSWNDIFHDVNGNAGSPIHVEWDTRYPKLASHFCLKQKHWALISSEQAVEQYILNLCLYSTRYVYNYCVLNDLRPLMQLKYMLFIKPINKYFKAISNTRFKPKYCRQYALKKQLYPLPCNRQYSDHFVSCKPKQETLRIANTQNNKYTQKNLPCNHKHDNWVEIKK